MALSKQDEAPMRRAIEASREALRAGDVPFGAALVSPAGELLLVSRNRQLSGTDLMAHAEVVLVREAVATLGAEALRGATVYASGEPCAMCCGTMFWAGVARVVFAASQQQIGQTLGGPLLPISCAQTLRDAAPAVQVDGPLLADEAVTVLQAFGVSAAG